MCQSADSANLDEYIEIRTAMSVVGGRVGLPPANHREFFRIQHGKNPNRRHLRQRSAYVTGVRLLQQHHDRRHGNNGCEQIARDLVRNSRSDTPADGGSDNEA